VGRKDGAAEVATRADGDGLLQVDDHDGRGTRFVAAVSEPGIGVTPAGDPAAGQQGAGMAVTGANGDRFTEPRTKVAEELSPFAPLPS